MHISDKGLDIIKEFEGYGRKLPNGDCTAYQEHLGNGKYDIPTIGWGCTEGVEMGMVWTRAEAETALRRELVRIEDGVKAAIKFVPNQNQYDAMVSLAYNIGTGGFAKSTVCRLANAGDFVGASRGFALWNKSQGQIIGGLVRRRSEEAALFMQLPNGIPSLGMVQSVDEPVEPVSNSTSNKVETGKQVVAGGGIIASITAYLGLMPDQIFTFFRDYGLSITIAGLGAIFIVSEVIKNLRKDS